MFQKSWKPNEIIEVTDRTHKQNVCKGIYQCSSKINIVLVPEKSNLIKEKREIQAPKR
jgi:hypothetical protein